MPEEPERSGDFATDQMVRDWLRKPFKPEQIGKIPASKGRPALDYVGHAAVTDRLNKIVPDWHYTVDEVQAVEGQCWIRGTMTIGGISRVEFGDGDDPKEAIGNFIRRGAMRFGVAIDLWSREELDSVPEGSGKAAGRKPASSGTGDGERRQGKAPSPTEAAGDASSPQRAQHPAVSTYPFDPADCQHKFPSGHWLRWDEDDRCPRCGTPKITAMEGTTADLGSA